MSEMRGLNFGDSIRNTFMCKVNSIDTGDSNGWDSGEAVDERCESLKGFDGVTVLRLTASR